jgi:hypothetical protein
LEPGFAPTATLFSEFVSTEIGSENPLGFRGFPGFYPEYFDANLGRLSDEIAPLRPP